MMVASCSCSMSVGGLGFGGRVFSCRYTWTRLRILGHAHDGGCDGTGMPLIGDGWDGLLTRRRCWKSACTAGPRTRSNPVNTPLVVVPFCSRSTQKACLVAQFSHCVYPPRSPLRAVRLRTKIRPTPPNVPCRASPSRLALHHAVERLHLSGALRLRVCVAVVGRRRRRRRGPAREAGVLAVALVVVRALAGP